MDTAVLDALRSLAVDSVMTASELEYLGALCRVLGYLPGAYLFHESQPRRFFGVILKGRVELQKGSRARPRVLQVLGPGDSFGELSLFDDYPHSATARVIEPAEVLELPREAIEGLAREQPELYTRLVRGAARTIAARLRDQQPIGEAYASGEMRREKDLLGERDVPAIRYYGVQTLRAVENFPITGIAISQYPNLIRALAAIKEAAAWSNHELGLLEERIATAIVAASRELRAGNLHGEFVVDVIQGGAGTSTNMNANEVIANRALELLGLPRGRYDVVHPNDHVNLSQSTNDVYPTAISIASIWPVDELDRAMAALRDAFLDKGREFAHIVKMGRTQLQDAVPMTLGQEFRA